ATECGDGAGGSGRAQRAAVGVALDHLAAAAHPYPLAAGVAHPVLGFEHVGMADDVFLQQLLHPRQVLGVDAVGAPVVGADFLAAAVAEQLVAAEPVELVGADVPVPELVTGTPQGQVQADRKSTRLNSSHVKISY